MRGPRLAIPACLAVTTMQLGCAQDPEPSADTSTSTSSSSSSSSTTAPTSSTSDASTSSSGTTDAETTLATTDDTSTSTTDGSSTSTSGADTSDSGSETGSPLPDCNAIEEPKACNAMPGCLYDVVVGQCDVDCTLIEDMALCVDQTGVCYWLDGACHHVAI